jgi:hypothetical protein
MKPCAIAGEDLDILEHAVVARKVAILACGLTGGLVGCRIEAPSSASDSGRVAVMAASRDSDRAALAASRDAGTQKSRSPLGLAAGEYKLTLHVTSWRHAGFPLDAEGSLSLRQLKGQRDLLGRGFQLYGWTDVDFRALGATLGETPPTSQDPESPGVLVKTSSARSWTDQPDGAPILLIGTLANSQTSRGAKDGAGIGLLVYAKDGHCLTGKWGSWGVMDSAGGQFRICPPR